MGIKVAVTSDLHGYIPEVPECDLLIVAGDIGLSEKFSHDPEVLLTDWFKWLKSLDIPVVAVAGNHDFRPEVLRNMPWIYLEDETVEVLGYKIFGTPWSNPFGYGWAFNMDEEDQVENLKKCPGDVDIIISHNPPKGYRDMVTWDGVSSHVGSQALRERMADLPNLKLVACGHIHTQYGQEWIVVNGSLVNHRYQVTNKPFVIELPNPGR